MTKEVPAMFMALYALLLLQSPAGETAGMPEVVAVVNGTRITRMELERRIAQSRSMDEERFDKMTPEARRRALARLLNARIVQELEYEDALKRGIRVADREVDSALQTAKQHFPSQAAFERSLKEGQISLPEWKTEMKRSLAVRNLEDKLAAESPGWRREEWIKVLLRQADIWVWRP